MILELNFNSIHIKNVIFVFKNSKLFNFFQFVWQNVIVVQLLGPHVFALRATGAQCLRFLGECDNNNGFVYRTCFSYKSKN